MPILSSFGGLSAIGRGQRAGGGVWATGGTIVEAGGYRTHTFTSTADLTVESGGLVEIWCMGGGGGGGYAGNQNCGATGGGSAGCAYHSGLLVTPGIITATVGTGGTTATIGYPSSAPLGANPGTASTFSSLTGNGGGGGWSYNTVGVGGSASGGTTNYTGNNGAAQSGSSGGKGGDGVTAYGGAGGSGASGVGNGNPGNPYGAGGGGGGANGGPWYPGGTGANGIVVVRYRI
jgi:trimeric autotransporter adhesin